MLLKKRKQKMQYDFEVCTTWIKVEAVLDEINRNGYALISVAYDKAGWTVFFGRPVDG